MIHDFSRVNTIVFDKTGTLTGGNPKVAETQYYSDDLEITHSFLASVEKESDHPLAKAIVEFLGEVDLYTVEHTDVIKGGGVIAKVDNQKVYVGNVTLMEKEVKLSEKILSDVKEFENRGNSIVLVAINDSVKALFGIKDQIRVQVKRI